MAAKGNTLLFLALACFAAGYLMDVLKGAVFGTRQPACTPGVFVAPTPTQVPAKVEQAPGYDPRYDVVMGLARYPGTSSAHDVRIFVDTLRGSGYVGRIVLFVHPDLAGNGSSHGLPAYREYLHANGVELIAVETAPCRFPFKGDEKTMEIRKQCPLKYPTLPLEYARFALARDWLQEEKRTGWMLLTDVRDTYFQRPPFADLGAPEGSHAYVYEEFFGVKGETRTQQQGKKRGIDTSHWFGRMAANCYGQDAIKSYVGKPMLCSGQIVSTHSGGVTMLTQYINEMLSNIAKGPKCVTPEIPDQPLLNFMTYKNMLDVEIVPFGTGLVMTLGGSCTEGPKRALLDQVTFDGDGFILDDKHRRAPVVHQYDRCA
eukprot:TRINITY_DN2898_c1_g6_i1.p1 TRINITY_DN2898_c1_g6~~TRINITY_DN2898_c1_g6_i1.p1  ORF type:complete len:395 (+),score=142.10 TRINITY_DN2898_c1_g6_i1:68-1186(+)